jgi:hypothetical protein
VTSRQIRFGAGWFVLHFSLILLFALRDLFSVLPASASWLPQELNWVWRSADAAVSTSLGERLPADNVWRQILAAYGNMSGIEGGYSYFAPSVPANCKLLFELSYPDRPVEYDLPHVKGAAAGYRVATLLDYLVLFHSIPLREAILKPLVYECWKQHPDATTIRAIVAVANLPTITEYKRGIEKSYDLAYSYEFRFRPKPAEPGTH